MGYGLWAMGEAGRISVVPRQSYPTQMETQRGHRRWPRMLPLRFADLASSSATQSSIPDAGPLYPSPIDVGSFYPAVPHGALRMVAHTLSRLRGALGLLCHTLGLLPRRLGCPLQPGACPFRVPADRVEHLSRAISSTQPEGKAEGQGEGPHQTNHQGVDQR